MFLNAHRPVITLQHQPVQWRFSDGQMSACRADVHVLLYQLAIESDPHEPGRLELPAAGVEPGRPEPHRV